MILIDLSLVKNDLESPGGKFADLPHCTTPYNDSQGHSDISTKQQFEIYLCNFQTNQVSQRVTQRLLSVLFEFNPAAV